MCKNFTMKKNYHILLAFFTSVITFRTGGDNMVADTTYKRALEEIKARRFEDAFDTYVNAFLKRRSAMRMKERQFVAFYRYQLANYLCTKTNFFIALPEGDMVTDLILSEYESFMEDIQDSSFPFTKESMIRLLEQLKIIFPCHFNTDIETFFYYESI